ncbi:hypothetical protein [Acinetobacter sp.]|uniref:hypothetical protein n=1 Tax=Acinetobacter sp. TaxID=472 RepID=UPI0024871985|nr:hypothetical protein [Acinetobacter sp.]MDI1225218.1 hypothetical protein [Acinetobacter sp.]
MTLLVASINEHKAIFLTDFQVTSKINGEIIKTDELNKYFKSTFNEHELYFLTAGSVNVWLKIKELINIPNLLLNKDISDVNQAFRDLLSSPPFRQIKGDSGGFMIHHDTTKNQFAFYQLELSPGYGAYITLLNDGIYSLGSGSKIITNCQNSIHNRIWTRVEDSLFQIKCNLETQIRSLFKPLNTDLNHFETTGVSETFTTILVENGELRFVDEETVEVTASVNTSPKEHTLNITHHQDGTSTIDSTLSGTNQIKSFGENLDRNGNKIDRL